MNQSHSIFLFGTVLSLMPFLLSIGSGKSIPYPLLALIGVNLLVAVLYPRLRMGGPIASILLGLLWAGGAMGAFGSVPYLQNIFSTPGYSGVQSGNSPMSGYGQLAQMAGGVILLGQGGSGVVRRP